MSGNERPDLPLHLAHSRSLGRHAGRVELANSRRHRGKFLGRWQQQGRHRTRGNAPPPLAIVTVFLLGLGKGRFERVGHALRRSVNASELLDNLFKRHPAPARRHHGKLEKVLGLCKRHPILHDSFCRPDLP